jgi:aminopeptidase N
MKVDVYTDNGVKKESIIVTEKQQTFEFTTDSRIKFVNVDAERGLLAVIQDNKPSSEYKASIMETPLFMDKHYAVNTWLDNMSDSITAYEEEIINYLLNHEFWGVRDLGLSAVEKLHPTQRILFDAKLAELAVKDDKSANRADAITLLAQNNPTKHVAVYQSNTKDYKQCRR